MHFVPPEIDQYAFTWTKAEPRLLEELANATRADVPCPQMLCGRLEGRLLKLLTRMTGAKRVLEIGMFTGYSALSIAEGLPEGGKLITCELDPGVIKVARDFFARSPHGSKIEILEGEALMTLRDLRGNFDLAFIDADKENYVNYYQFCVEALRSGGVIVVDNCLWSGGVLNPRSEEDKVIHSLNTIIAQDPRVENVLLPLRDGVNVVMKI